MKLLLQVLIAFVLFSPSPIYAQDFEQELKRAHDAQNPNVSIAALGKIKEDLSQVSDSLKLQFYLAMGIAYGQLGRSDSSLFYLSQVETLANDSSRVLIDTWNTKGLVYMSSGDFEESLNQFHKALRLAETKDEEEIKIIKIIGNAAGVFYQLEDFSSAIQYMERAISLSESVGLNHGVGVSNLRLAIIYMDMDSLQRSIEHLRVSEHILAEERDTIMLLYAKNTLGGILQRQNLYREALREFQVSERLAMAISNTEDIIFAKASIAELYLTINQFDKAEQFSKEVLELASANGFMDRVGQAHDILYQIYMANQSYKQALIHRNASLAINDSISGVEVKSRIAELETKYETEKKEAEIEQLSLENSLHEANLARSRNAQLAIGIGSVLTIILVIVFFTLRHKRHVAEREAQELQIEALQKRVMEIQSSSDTFININLDQFNQKLHNDLTEREFEILRLSLENKTNSEISEELFISVSTVKFHLRNIYAKLGVNNRKEAFEYVAKKA